MMKNIFENAKFGDCFRTRDGRKAIYLGDNTCWIEGCKTEIGYSRNGLFVDIQEHSIDIVSEWHEEINEEELDIIALPFVRDYVKNHPKSLTSYTDGFKAGYRKAKEL